MTLGVGTDIVAVERIAALIEQGGQRFLERCFTADEIEYCMAKAKPSLHFAARLAAKEAVLKALPIPWDGPVPWLNIEILRDQHGHPAVLLSGDLLASATHAHIGVIRISLSHSDEYATAVAVVDAAS